MSNSEYKYSEVVDFKYNRDNLLKVVEQTVKEEGFLEKSVPISTFKNAQRPFSPTKILEVLGLKFGDSIFGIYITSLTIACLRPFERSAIHVDRNFDNTPTMRAFNVPVTLCNNVTMNWYNVRPNGKIKTLKSAGGWEIPGLSLDQSVLCYSKKADKPFVVNPSSFHDIVNEGNQIEIIISIRSGLYK